MLDQVQQFTDMLIRELILRAPTAQSQSVDTIFFGGGTPSLLSEAQLAAIMETILDQYQIREDAEITLESNPGTLTLEKTGGNAKTGD